MYVLIGFTVVCKVGISHEVFHDGLEDFVNNEPLKGVIVASFQLMSGAQEGIFFLSGVVRYCNIWVV